MKTALIKLRIRTSKNGYKLYAVGFDGKRREEIPLKQNAGEIMITINTAMLKHGPTPFLELLVEQ